MKAVLVIALLLVASQAFKFDKNSVNMAVCLSQLPSYGSQINTMIQSKNFTNLDVLYNDMNKGLQYCGIDFEMGLYEPESKIKCIADIAKIGKLAVKIKADLQDFNLTELGADFKNLYTLVQQALVDCKNSTHVKLQEETNKFDINKILDCVGSVEQLVKGVVEEVSQNKMTFKQFIKTLPKFTKFFIDFENKCNVPLKIEEFINDKQECMDDINQIATLAQQLKDDVKHFNLKNLASHIGQLAQLVQKALNDCQNSTKSLHMRVLQAEVPQKIEESDEESDDEDDMSDMFSLFHDFDLEGVTDFVKSFGSAMAQFDGMQNNPKCTKKMQKIKDLAANIQSDVDDWNLGLLGSHIQKAFVAVEEAMEACQDLLNEDASSDEEEQEEEEEEIVAVDGESVSSRRALQSIGERVQNEVSKVIDFLKGKVNDKDQCIKDIAQIAQIAVQLKEDIQNFDIKAIATDIGQLYNLVQQALNDCQNEEQKLQMSQEVMNVLDTIFKALKVDINDKQQCLADISQIGDLAITLKQNVMDFNIPNLTKDIAQLTTLVQQALDNCQQQKN